MAQVDKKEGPRSFARFIEQVGDGDLLADASSGLYELSNALQDESLRLNAKVKGKLIIEIPMTCDPRGVMGIDFNVKVNKPTKKRATAQAWVTKGGNVIFESPRQTSLPLREVSGRGEAADVGERPEARDV